MKPRHDFVVWYGAITLIFALVDFCGYMFELQLMWVILSCLVFGIFLFVKKFRRFLKIGVACLSCSMIVLTLSGIVGIELNKRSYAEAAIVVNEVEKFRLERGRYPTTLEILTLIDPEVRSRFRQSIPFQGRWTYETRENDDYRLSMWALPVQYVTWNRKTKTWKDYHDD